jgi:hypothetical protein
MKKLIVLSLSLVSVLFFSCMPDHDNSVEKHNTLNPVVPEHETSVLIDETVNVPAGSYRAYNLYGRVGYTIHIDISSDTDVNVWVMSEGEYSHFKKGESFDSVSSASREKVLKFSCDFSTSGSYYLVLDNKFSWLTSKNVSVKAVSESLF